jgi:hypothetical protein
MCYRSIGLRSGRGPRSLAVLKKAQCRMIAATAMGSGGDGVIGGIKNISDLLNYNRNLSLLILKIL